jgi:arsenate reductase
MLLLIKHLFEMNIIIIGTKKCKESQKAERFFKERRIPFHFRDLNDKSLTKGELDNIVRIIPLEDLIDKEGKRYKDRGMQFMVFDIEEELLSDPLLLKTPIVRNERLVTVGYQPEVWKVWIVNN